MAQTIFIRILVTLTKDINGNAVPLGKDVLSRLAEVELEAIELIRTNTLKWITVVMGCSEGSIAIIDDTIDIVIIRWLSFNARHAQTNIFSVDEKLIQPSVLECYRIDIDELN